MAEATAIAPETRGGWGNGLPTRLSDLVLLRQAIKEDWDVSAAVRTSILRELSAAIESNDERMICSVFRSFLAMENANIRVRSRNPRRPKTAQQLALRSGAHCLETFK